MQRVDAHVAAPEVFEGFGLVFAVLVTCLVQTGQSQLRAEPAACVGSINVWEAENAEAQVGSLAELLFGGEFPFRLFGVRLAGLVALLLRRAVRVVDCACAHLDVRFHAALGCLLSDCHAQLVAAQLVHFVFLREARFAAAVEDIVEFSF